MGTSYCNFFRVLSCRSSVVSLLCYPSLFTTQYKKSKQKKLHTKKRKIIFELYIFMSVGSFINHDGAHLLNTVQNIAESSWKRNISQIRIGITFVFQYKYIISEDEPWFHFWFKWTSELKSHRQKESIARKTKKTGYYK